VSTEYELHNLIENYFAPVVEIFYVTTQLLRGALKSLIKNLTRVTFQSHLQSILFVFVPFILLMSKIEEKQFPATRNMEKLENEGRQLCLTTFRE
jgi:hypothetical protein